MTTDDKLRHFMDVSMQSAMSKKESMVKEYKAGLDIQFENYKEDTKTKYQLQEKAALEGLRRDFSKEFSLQQQHIKRKLTHKKDELKEKIFSEVTGLLNDFLLSDDYTELLVREINFSLSVAPAEEITIFIDPLDEDKKELLETRTGADITISAYSFGRGMRAIIPSKNILIDYSFNSKLHEIKDDYTIIL
ncbi:MAG: ATPase [Lachnospiraceae bacterium]|nr:ATPase [Lachnospiraceae bacterium]